MEVLITILNQGGNHTLGNLAIYQGTNKFLKKNQINLQIWYYKPLDVINSVTTEFIIYLMSFYSTFQGSTEKQYQEHSVVQSSPMFPSLQTVGERGWFHTSGQQAWAHAHSSICESGMTRTCHSRKWSMRACTRPQLVHVRIRVRARWLFVWPGCYPLTTH